MTRLERENRTNLILGDLEKRNRNWEKIEDMIDGKIDKAPGKDLSTNDYTNADKREVEKIKDKADIEYVDRKIGADIPADAEFTDTRYTAGENIDIDVNNKISVTGQLGLTEEEVENVKVKNASNADTVSGYTVSKDVPMDAEFTDTRYLAGENVTISENNVINARSGGLGLFQFEVSEDGDLILHYPDGDPEPNFEIVNGELIFTFG